MIPKIIHYCWFGGNEIPEHDKKCMSCIILAVGSHSLNVTLQQPNS